MEVADAGILFLDEISSMPMDIQAKLLRAIEERAFRRVGGTNLIKVDVQILAASNRKLANLINKGDFREDLYYRLKVVDLNIPPLRDRREDIPELVGFFHPSLQCSSRVKYQRYHPTRNGSLWSVMIGQGISVN